MPIPVPCRQTHSLLHARFAPSSPSSPPSLHFHCVSFMMCVMLCDVLLCETAAAAGRRSPRPPSTHPRPISSSGAGNNSNRLQQQQQPAGGTLSYSYSTSPSSKVCPSFLLPACRVFLLSIASFLQCVTHHITHDSNLDPRCPKTRVRLRVRCCRLPAI